MACHFSHVGAINTLVHVSGKKVMRCLTENVSTPVCLVHAAILGEFFLTLDYMTFKTDFEVLKELNVNLLMANM